MPDMLRFRIGRRLVPIPGLLWRAAISRATRDTARSFERLSREHRAVRRFAVEEITRTGKPVSPAIIADRLELSPSRVAEILADLERRKLYLHRNAAGDVAWAYPVTADPTPHHMTFASGERLDAA